MRDHKNLAELCNRKRESPDPPKHVGEVERVEPEKTKDDESKSKEINRNQDNGGTAVNGKLEGNNNKPDKNSITHEDALLPKAAKSTGRILRIKLKHPKPKNKIRDINRKQCESNKTSVRVKDNKEEIRKLMSLAQPASESDATNLSTCHYCLDSVADKNMGFHILTQHKKSTFRCTVCVGSKIKKPSRKTCFDTLEAAGDHMNEVHNIDLMKMKTLSKNEEGSREGGSKAGPCYVQSLVKVDNGSIISQSWKCFNLAFFFRPSALACQFL